MKTNIEQLDDQEYELLLKPIWNYLAVEDTPERSDIIFVFGGLDITVPARAAELFLDGFAPLILVSGKSGPFSERVFDKPEAEVFRDQMLTLGVPADRIVTETKASNTLENVIFGMSKLEENAVEPQKAMLVGKPFLMRRCCATFERQCARVNILSCPPKGSMLQFCDRSRVDFAKRLIAELERLTRYSAAGDISPQQVPKDVEQARKELDAVLTPAT